MTERKYPKGIRYRMLRNYKYQLWDTYSVKTPIRPDGNYDIHQAFMSLELDGTLTLRSGYAWVGCTGGRDDETNMRAGALHDAFHQMLRMVLLSLSKKAAIDAYFASVCKEAGMKGSWRDLRRKAYHLGVQLGGMLGIGLRPQANDTLRLYEAP